MALSRIKTWSALEVLTASDLNAEFNNILNNALSLISPLTGNLDLNGNVLLMDAAGVTEFSSSAARALILTPGAKSGTPSTTGATFNLAAHTYTDSNTATSGTAAAFAGVALQRSTVGASNTGVTITEAATLYVAGSPIAGSNMTLTNPYALWVDAGLARFDGDISIPGSIAASLPAAAAAQDGRITMDTTNSRFIFYCGGSRFYVTGTSF